jgi:hypothetical protein
MGLRAGGEGRDSVSVDYHGLVRARDPGSSWEAAGQQNDVKIGRVTATILDLYKRFGPMIDEELCARYAEVEQSDPTVQRATAQSIRSRRHEAVVQSLVRDTRRHRPTSLGNPASVHALPEPDDPGTA